jgi:large subunit ribosomal protein L1
MANKQSKRFKSVLEKVDAVKEYSLDDAVEMLKDQPATKFDQSLELSFQLGIDTKQAEQAIRGTVNLPNGSGRSVKVLCFVKGEEAKDAEKAGAEFVGADDLIAKINGGWFGFDVIVAHPEMMRDISKLGRVLGPKGMMPTPKAGTVTKNVGKAIEELKKGKIELKSDKTGGLHAACGKLSFEKSALVENVKAVMHSMSELRPQSVKGDYVKRVSISSSMGPGLKLSLAGLGV